MFNPLSVIALLGIVGVVLGGCASPPAVRSNVLQLYRAKHVLPKGHRLDSESDLEGIEVRGEVEHRGDGMARIVDSWVGFVLAKPSMYQGRMLVLTVQKHEILAPRHFAP